MPIMHLLVGLPGTGKTTYARHLEESERALRLTPDEWMIPLFGGQQPGNTRDILEGRLIWIGYRALLAGIDAVIDFGLWSREERDALRWIAVAAGGQATITQFDASESVRRERATARYAATPHSEFPMSDGDHDQAAALFQPVTPVELQQIRPAPSPYNDWGQWAAQRWPSLPVIDQSGSNGIVTE